MTTFNTSAADIIWREKLDQSSSPLAGVSAFALSLVILFNCGLF